MFVEHQPTMCAIATIFPYRHTLEKCYFTVEVFGCQVTVQTVVLTTIPTTNCCSETSVPAYVCTHVSRERQPIGARQC